MEGREGKRGGGGVSWHEVALMAGHVPTGESSQFYPESITCGESCMTMYTFIFYFFLAATWIPGWLLVFLFN